MTSLDDKLLGEKRENYCSSSEDEDEPSGAGNSRIDTEHWEGYSQNTGPKGVIRDWQLFKEHEKRVRENNTEKLLEQVKQTSISCKPYSEEDDKELQELMDDSVLQDFVNKRMETLKKSRVPPKHPGVVVHVTDPDQFLDVIDTTHESIPVVIHIYDDNHLCEAINQAFAVLAKKHTFVQFCSVSAKCVGVSKLFRDKGVPAILVYKSGALIGNFVQLNQHFDDTTPDVEQFLVHHSVIHDF